MVIADQNYERAFLAMLVLIVASAVVMDEVLREVNLQELRTSLQMKPRPGKVRWGPPQRKIIRDAQVGKPLHYTRLTYANTTSMPHFTRGR